MGWKKSNDGDKKSKKNKKSKGIAPPAHDDKAGSGVIADPRFASVHSDPRFQRFPRNKAKVEIDSRFDRIFTDRKFVGSSAPVDKRGRPRKTQSENFLKEYYEVDDSKAKAKEEEESESEEEKKIEESDTESSDESVESDLDGLDSDTSEEDEGLVYRLDDDEPEALEENVPEIEEETRRLAIVNLDWRHVKASDLYVMLSSFLSESGQILSVSVYPSEFGLQRMKEEDLHGPVGLFDDESEKSNDEEDDDDGDEELDNEKLRAYEKSKLRYYYAVVECDSVATADHLYKSCDGVELARSSNVLDMRFIPDSMEFKHPPRDVATEAPSKYEGLNFQTQALQQSKIHLSWDEDEPDRAKTLKRKLNAEQLEDLELKEYLASDESESEEDEEDATEDNGEKNQKKRDLYQALLKSGNNSDVDAEEEDDDDAQNMEVTFNTGLEDQSEVFLKKNKKQETVWEAHLRARSEKRKLRKNESKGLSGDESSDGDREAVEEPGDFFVDEQAVKKHDKSEGKRSKRAKREEDPDRQAEATEAELELLLADDTVAGTGVKGYSLKPKKVKGKGGRKVKKTLEEDEIPPIVDDPRFSMVFTSPDFAMDPTDPQFKRTATYARQVAVRKQKHDKEAAGRCYPVPAEPQVTADERANSDDRSSNKKKYELSTEIRSVKMRCQQIKPASDEKAQTQTRDGPSKSTKKKGKKIHDNDLSSMVQSVKRHSLSNKKRS